MANFRGRCKHALDTIIIFVTALYGVGAYGESELWQTLSLAGNKMGYRHLQYQKTDTELISRETLVITVSQPGAGNASTTTVLEYRETLDGKPLAIDKRVTSAAANHHMRAKVGDGILLISQNELTANSRQYVIPEPFYLSEGLRQALLKGAGQTAPLDYFNWNFSSQQFEQIQLTVRPHHAAENPDYTWQLQRRVIAETPRTSQIFTDHNFYPLAEVSRSGSDELRIVNCTQECATADFQPVTHVYRQLISSPYKISDGALRGKIRFLLRGELPNTPPTTNEQTVKVLDDGVEITVCDSCGAEAPPDRDALTETLQANYWLASNEAVFQTVVKDVLGDKKRSAAAQMRRLTHFVSRHMNSEASYSGYATALEAYHSKQGDCTEHALLLATLARAAGIPSRVAFGLVYSNDRFLGRKYVFVPHAWVQTWTGEKWQSFDSGLGEFTAGHIALGINNGEQSEILKLNKQLHQLKIVSAVQIKSR